MEKEDVRCLSCGLDQIEESWKRLEESVKLTFAALGFERGQCPYCHEDILIGFDERFTKHNIGWLPPDPAGVCYPVKCLGSLQPYRRPPIPKESLN